MTTLEEDVAALRKDVTTLIQMGQKKIEMLEQLTSHLGLNRTNRGVQTAAPATPVYGTGTQPLGHIPKDELPDNLKTVPAEKL